MQLAPRFEAVTSNKSAQVAVVFALLAITLSFVPSPFWDGTFLTIVPKPPPALVKGPEAVEIASSEPAPIIDLPTTIPEAGSEGVRVGEIEGTPNAPFGADGDVAEGAAVPRDNARGSERESASADAQLRDAIHALASQLGTDRDLLSRPCRVEGSDGLCLHRQLDRYFEKLRLVALKRAEEPVRISQFGDSMIMGDQYCGELRRLMQNQFGDGGHGFLYPGNPVRRFGFENIRLGLSDRWEVRTIVTNSTAGGRLFGFSGAEFRATDGPTFTMHAYDRPPGDEFERIGLLFFAPPGVEEGSVFMSVDGERTQETFPVTAGSSGIHWFEVPRGPHSVTFSYFQPGFRYYGIISELSGPGVVVDNVGLVSSRMRNLDKIGEEHWRDQIRLRDPDLMSFMYGGNAAGESREAFLSHEDEYRESYGGVLSRLEENNPEVDCLIMGVLTRGKREGGRIGIYGAIPEIARTQRSIAEQHGCAFFDQYTFMGGEDGARAWFQNRPQLLGSDLAHPTREGYTEIARAFYTELMHEFARFLDERKARLDAGVPAITPLAGAARDAPRSAAERDDEDASSDDAGDSQQP